MNTGLEFELHKEISLLNNNLPEESRLQPEVIDWWVSTLNSFIRRTAAKMIKGQAEHGGHFLRDCDHLPNAIDEVIDLTHYLFAEKHKQITRKGS